MSKRMHNGVIEETPDLTIIPEDLVIPVPEMFGAMIPRTESEVADLLAGLPTGSCVLSSVVNADPVELNIPTSESVTIDEGAAVEYLAVNLTLFATDDTGVTEMMISNAADFTGGSWENYATAKVWGLASGADGARTVYVKFRDAALNVSGVATDSTTYTAWIDTTSPTPVSVSIDEGATVATLNVNLTISAADDVLVTEMMIGNDAGYTGASWVSYATSAAHTLPAGDGLKTVYVKFRDAALNESVDATDTTTYTETVNAAPGAPVISILSVGDTVATITVDTASTDTEDGTVNLYDVFVDSVEHAANVTIAQSATYQLTGLTNDVQVAITLKAQDSGGLLSVASNIVNATPNGVAYLLNDLFTDTTGVSLSAHTPEAGGVWTVQEGEVTIQNNKAVGTSGSNRVNVATIPVGVADTTLSCTITHDGTFGPITGVIARYTDMNNFIQLSSTFYDGAEGGPFARWNMYKNVGGVFTEIAEWNDTNGITKDYAVDIICLGTSIKVNFDDVERINVTEVSNQTGTGVGIRLISTDAFDPLTSSVDNFKVLA